MSLIGKTTFELKFMIKKQGLKLKFKPIARGGWDGWIRTNECRYQKPVPYHLATSQKIAGLVHSRQPR